LKKFYKETVFVLFSVAGAFIVSGLIILFAGENPLTIFSLFVEGVFGSSEGILYTLFFATPLIFTGLSVAFSLKGGLFNIGAEGQLYIGSIAAAVIGFSLTGFPAYIVIPLAMFASIAGGGLWGAIAGYLKAQFGSHEVINTIMLNFIAISLTGYLATGPLKNPGDQIPQTQTIVDQAKIPQLHDFIPGVPSSVPLNISFLFAIIAAVLVYFFFKHTKPGFEIRAVGENPDASRLSGISLFKTHVIIMVISGALAGMVGSNEIMGYRYRFLTNFSPGYGYLGIAVALLGRNHPLGVVLSALFFGALSRGGLLIDIHSDKISRDVIFIIQGIIILFVVSRQFLEIVIKRSIIKKQDIF